MVEVEPASLRAMVVEVVALVVDVAPPVAPLPVSFGTVVVAAEAPATSGGKVPADDDPAEAGGSFEE
jgi:hypothetical protein